jgi:hypothetical protein
MPGRYSGSLALVPLLFRESATRAKPWGMVHRGWQHGHVGEIERGAQRALSTDELAPRYVTTALLALVAAIVGAAGTVTIARQAHLGCERTTAHGAGSGGSAWVCPDGISYAIPALLGGAAAALAVVTLMAVLTARRAHADTVERMAKHALWLVFVVVLLPGLGWPLLTLLNSGNAYGLFGLTLVGFAALPLVVAYRRRKALPGVLALCLLGPITALILWQRLFLLIPLATVLAGGWALALTLSLWASRPRIC